MKKQQMNVLVFCCKERFLSSIARNQLEDRFKKFSLEFFYNNEKVSSFETFLSYYEVHKGEYSICVCLGGKNSDWEKDLLLLKDVIIIYEPVLNIYAKNYFVVHKFFESCKWNKYWHKNVKLRNKDTRFLYGISRR